MNSTIITDEGKEVTVRRLRLFELDLAIPRPRPQPYTVTIEASQGTFEQVFNLTEPRIKPDVTLEDCPENTPEWYDWREYLRYREGVLYYKQLLEATEEYHQKVADYIYQNCLDKTGRQVIITGADWEKVYQAALCPEVEFEDLKTVTDQVFMASYDGLPLFEAFENEVEGGLGSYLSIRAWEVKLQKELVLSEEEYLELGVMQRAIMIMAERIPDLISQIDLERQRKQSYATAQKSQSSSDAEKKFSSG